MDAIATFLLLAIGAAVSAAPGETWPAFRGTGNSVSDAADLPLRWSDDAGIAWQADLPGYGQSSPVVWRDRVFVTSALGENKDNVSVACVDLPTGKLLWSKTFKSTQPGQINGYISVAAPTPAVDERRVYAFFETGNLVALDHDGEVVWQRSLVEDFGPFQGNHGLGASLGVTADAVLVLVCHDGPSYLLAADKATGKTLWKTDRPTEVSWSSPIVDDAGGTVQIVVSSNGTCEALDAKTGKQLWLVDGLEGNTVPSATVTKDLIVVGSSQIGANLAIRRGGDGNVTKSHVAWRSADATATFSSPLVYRDHAYLVSRAGVAYCLDLTGGKTVWTRRIGGSCWASPIGADGRVYFFGKSGDTTVVAAGPALKVLAENALTVEDRVYGVAAVNGAFVVRTGTKLIRIGGPVQKQEQNAADAKPVAAGAKEEFPALPKAITSFGAASVGDWLYTYGGHYGSPHHYSQAGQSNVLQRLNVKQPKAWEPIATGPKLQGLALVSYDGALYRVGGFTARNRQEEDQDLWSIADFARFDPASGKWQELPPMPEPRSSFDATMIGSKLYVAGGWGMRGKGADAEWLDSAYVIDLSQPELKWEALPKSPFKRRAVSLAALDGKVFVIGGMQPDGKATTNTAVFDPQRNEWTDGPALPGEAMEGFGTDCCELDGRLYVSTMSGNLLRLAADGKSWEKVRKLRDARFFHQMLPLDSPRLILLGGANMETGKFSRVEVVEPER
jgi:outer membrane protein assembly factor BamB